MADDAGRGPQEATSLVLRRRYVAELLTEGYRVQQEIAEELLRRYSLEVSRSTISRDLQHIRRDWRNLATEQYHAAIGRQLATLERIAREAWRGWRRSLEDAQVRVAKKVTAHPKRVEGAEGQVVEVVEKPGRDETRLETKRQAGDPRFLAVLERCVQQQCKILGLEAPVRIADHKEALASLLGCRPEELPDTLIQEEPADGWKM